MYQVLSFPVAKAIYCYNLRYTKIFKAMTGYDGISWHITKNSIVYRKAEDLIHRFWLDI
jgi:hypothetical protein